MGLSKEIVFKLGSREWTNGVRSLSLCVGIILSYEGATKLKIRVFKYINYGLHINQIVLIASF